MEKIERLKVAKGEEGRDEQEEHRGFLEQWKYSYDTIIVDTCHYTFFPSHRLHNTNNEP